MTVRQLLSHSSGLPAWRPFYESLAAGDPDGRQALIARVLAQDLEAAPGTRSVYSDLGFIVLGLALERVSGRRIDALAHELVFEPLGMASTQFVDLLATPRAPRPHPVAPTEVCPWRGLVTGEVHDDNCHKAGGVLGHAGLFSTVHDLSALCAALVAAWQGTDAPRAWIARDVVREFVRPAGVKDSTWRLGWDGPSPPPGVSQSGELWPRHDAVGHMGFTGCSVWIDLQKSRWVVLLTNRVHPARSDDRIKQVRPLVHEAIVRALTARTG